MTYHVEEKIRDFLVDQLLVEESDVQPSAELMVDLGADSLDIVVVVMAIEEEFELEFDESFYGVKEGLTVGELVQYVKERIR